MTTDCIDVCCRAIEGRSPRSLYNCYIASKRKKKFTRAADNSQDIVQLFSKALKDAMQSFKPKNTKNKIGKKLGKPIKTYQQTKNFKIDRFGCQNTSDEPYVLPGTWIECVRCKKWRFACDIHDPSEVSEKWFCGLQNKWKNFSTDMQQISACQEPEEASFEMENDAHKLDPNLFLFNEFTAGSIVWAKMKGFPWWPAMIDLDMFGRYAEYDPVTHIATNYNVVFLDPHNMTTRRVAADQLRKYTTGENLKPIVGKYKTKISEAILEANEALKLPLDERISVYGYPYNHSMDQTKGPARYLFADKRNLGNDITGAQTLEQLGVIVMQQLREHSTEKPVMNSKEIFNDLTRCQPTKIRQLIKENVVTKNSAECTKYDKSMNKQKGIVNKKVFKAAEKRKALRKIKKMPKNSSLQNSDEARTYEIVDISHLSELLSPQKSHAAIPNHTLNVASPAVLAFTDSLENRVEDEMLVMRDDCITVLDEEQYLSVSNQLKGTDASLFELADLQNTVVGENEVSSTFQLETEIDDLEENENKAVTFSSQEKFLDKKSMPLQDFNFAQIMQTQIHAKQTCMRQVGLMITSFNLVGQLMPAKP